MILNVVFLVAFLYVLARVVCRRLGKVGELVHRDWFEDPTRFPYEAFPIHEREPEYREHVAMGRDLAGKKSVVFAGCCINIAGKLEKLKARIYHMGSFFRSWDLVIFENDSTDDTRSLLAQWAQEDSRVHLIPCPEDDKCLLKNKRAVSYGGRSETRMKLMSDFRNRILQYVVAHFSDRDVLCMMDLDLAGPISAEGFLYSFGVYDEWDVMTAFGVTGLSGLFFYYDTFAYDDYEVQDHLQTLNLRILYRTSQARRGHGTLIPVRSAFAGLGLYKMNLFQGAQYPTYTPKDGIYDRCEHRVFHENIIEDMGRFRFYINPNMVILVGDQGP